MNITLLRHAQTPGNRAHRYIGVTDESLSEEGIKQAEQRGQDEHVTRVYTSHLLRTQQTAQLLFPKAEIVALAALGEMDFGTFEGRTADEMEHDHAYRSWVEGGCEGTCPGGEDKATVTKRCVESFLSVLKQEVDKGAEELFFVVHGGTIMSILSELALPQQAYFEWSVPHCRGYLLAYATAEAAVLERPLQVIAQI